MSEGLPALVDTHCHLVLLEERGLLDRALEGAAAAGVDEIISVGLNLDNSDRNRAIAEQHPGVYFTCGWHPHEPAVPDAPQLEALAELLGHPKAVAVGEVGLDLFFRPGLPRGAARYSAALVSGDARARGRCRQAGAHP